MISVMVSANNQDKKFLTALQNILSRSFGTINCIGGCLDARNENPELIVADTASFDFVYSNVSIIIVKDSGGFPVNLETEKQAVAIVDSGSMDTVRMAGNTKFPAITCGLSAMDTITLSSISEDSAVINVQRSITCFDGTVIEPQEIPVSLYSPIDSFALMSVAGIFILSGNISKLPLEKL